MTESISLRIVRALAFHGDERWNYRGLIHPFNTVYFVTGGDGHIRLGGQITDMRPGWVYLIPPHVTHDVWCGRRVDKVYVDVHVELLPGFDVFSDTNEVLALFIGEERCQRVMAWCQGGLRRQLALRGALSIVLADFMQEEPQLPARMSDCLPIISYIQENLSAQLRREEIAARFGKNPTVLSRIFRKAFGCGVKEYTAKLLTARLAEELTASDKTLQKLAEEYGFCDGYYLSAFFRRNMGISPQKYRQVHRMQ